MTRDQLLAPTKGKRFHPFNLHTIEGQTYAVTHPEQYWVSPKGETVLVYLSDVIAFIDADEVASIDRSVTARPRK